MKKIIIVTFSTLLLFNACKKEEDDNLKTTLQIPANYDGSTFLANTATQTSVLNQLSALATEAQRGRDAANTVERSVLEQLFSVGSPSLSDVITNYYKGRILGDGKIIDELAKASGTTWTPSSPDGSSQGGVYGGYLFDEYGVEQEQLLEKGQFGATHYNHAVSLMNGSITLATVDQLVAIFGAKPAFANSGSNNVGSENRDRFMANYGARRDKNDGNGMYSQIKRAFITLQAAVKAGTLYNDERNKALKDIQLIWEKINAATVVNYCHTPISKLSGTSPTDADKSSSLHAIGEAIGFLQGFKTINSNYRKITDAQIDEILVLFNAPANGTASVYKFATDPVNELSKLQQAINKLQTIYGFSAQEIEDFKSNWVNVQNR
jgi:hypothetical protein